MHLTRFSRSSGAVITSYLGIFRNSNGILTSTQISRTSVAATETKGPFQSKSVGRTRSKSRSQFCHNPGPIKMLTPEFILRRYDDIVSLGLCFRGTVRIEKHLRLGVDGYWDFTLNLES